MTAAPRSADAPEPPPIPLALVTGFLGTGKTTLLRRYARSDPPRRRLFLVNEFAPADIDGAVLAADGADVLSLPGGSIFCRCLVTQFIGQLRQVAERWTSAQPPFEGVVIEASGMADPRVLGRMLEETGLHRRFRLASIVALADPVRLPKLLRTLPSARAQLETADVVVLNRTDLATAEQTEAAEREILAIRPGARIVRTAFCADAPDPFPAGAAPRAAGGDYAKCRDPEFATAVAATPAGGVDVARLERALRAAGDDVYRMKGFARVAGLPVRLEYAGGRLTLEPAAEIPGGRGELVIIFRGAATETVRRSVLDTATGGDAGASPDRRD